MKKIQKTLVALSLVFLFASCQSNTGVNQTLSKQETRMEMMNQIANDSTMAKEMMGAMMNSQNGKMMMQQHQLMMMGDNFSMMKMMKDNPTMMQPMMAAMMETAKGDTSMMSNMCKTMMGNKEMMDMMHKMKGEKKDMNKMEGMDNKGHH